MDAAMINAVKMKSFLFMVSFLLVLEFGFLNTTGTVVKGF